MYLLRVLSNLEKYTNGDAFFIRSLEMSDVEEIVFCFSIPVKIILLFFFIRMSCDIHRLRIKWYDQIKFDNDKIEKFDKIEKLQD